MLLHRDEMVSTSWYQPLVFSWLIPGFYWRKNQTEKTRPMTGIDLRVTKFYLFIEKLNSLKSNKLSIFNKILTIQTNFFAKNRNNRKNPKNLVSTQKTEKTKIPWLFHKKPWYLSSLTQSRFYGFLRTKRPKKPANF